MNNEEISKIQDAELRNIYSKYWKMRNDAFLDEHGIPDHELKKVVERIDAAEAEEIATYLAKKNITHI